MTSAEPVSSGWKLSICLRPEEAAARFRDAAQFIRAQLGAGARGVLEIGHKLHHVHNVEGGPNFANWLKTEFAWSRSTASKYMTVARVFGKVEGIEQIQSTALYLLARKEVSPVARQEALRMATEGLPVSVQTARTLIRQHAGDPAPKPAPRPVGRVALLNRARKLPVPEILQLAEDLMRIVDSATAKA